MIHRAITVTPAFTEAEIDQRFGHLTAAERVPIYEFDVLEAARKIAHRYGQFDAATAIEAAQRDMVDTFAEVLATTDTDRPMLRSADEVAQHCGFDTFAAYEQAVDRHGEYDNVQLSGGGREITYSAWRWTEGESDPCWKDDICLPCTPEAYDAMVASVIAMRDDYEEDEDEALAQ